MALRVSWLRLTAEVLSDEWLQQSQRVFFNNYWTIETYMNFDVNCIFSETIVVIIKLDDVLKYYLRPKKWWQQKSGSVERKT